MRKFKKALVVLPLVAMTLLAACGDDSGDSTSDTTAAADTTATADTTAATEETTAPADTAAAAASDPSKGEIPEGGAEVAIAGDVTTWTGKKVGIANLAPVPGAERWSKPLQACIEKNGGTVDYQDVGGDPTKLPALLEGWASAKVDAVFNIGIDMTGQ